MNERKREDGMCVRYQRGWVEREKRRQKNKYRKTNDIWCCFFTAHREGENISIRVTMAHRVHSEAEETREEEEEEKSSESGERQHLQHFQVK